MIHRFVCFLVAAFLVLPTVAAALTLPERQPDTPSTSPACNAFDSCVCTYGGSCFDVCASTWCANASPSDACFRCIVQDQTSAALGCGHDFDACYPGVCSGP